MIGILNLTVTNKKCKNKYSSGLFGRLNTSTIVSLRLKEQPLDSRGWDGEVCPTDQTLGTVINRNVRSPGEQKTLMEEHLHVYQHVFTDGSVAGESRI